MSSKLGKRGQVIHSQAREIIYNVYKYLRDVDSDKSLKELKEAVVAATGVSLSSVVKIINEETLRKYPPVAYTTRVAVKDYQVPGTDTIIEEGIDVIISILELHGDPEYYPDPEKFDPEQFSEENKHQRLPFTYMPFGEGPRIHIGLRFGLKQLKVGLAVLLQHYKFSLNSKTQVPFQMEPYSFTPSPKNGIFLDMEKVTS